MLKLPCIRFLVFFLILAAAPVAEAVDLKIATLSPDGSNWMVKLRKGAAEIELRTEKRVRFKFYPGGVMGDDKAVLRKIRIGQLHGAVVTNGVLTKYYPDNQIYNLPIKFNSFDQVDYVRKQMDTIIIDGFKKGGFVTFGLAEGGFAYIMSKAPIMTVDDLRQQKVWVPKDDTMALTISKAFGVTPIPLTPAEVRTGLQTGLINTVAVMPIGAIALQWHTQIKYLTDAPLIYVYGFLTINQKAFRKLNPADQDVVNEVMTQVMKQIDQQNRSENIKAMQVLQNQGIKIVNIEPDELANWRKIAAGVSDRMVTAGKLSPQIVELLEKHLEDFKKYGNPANGSKNQASALR